MGRGYSLRQICRVTGARFVLPVKSSFRFSGADARAEYTKPREVFFDIDAGEKRPSLKCAAVVTERPLQWLGSGACIIAVKDARKAYERMCEYVLAGKPDVVRIGVGGSVGKTSMKDMIAAVLAAYRPAQKSFANSNSYFGLLKQFGRIRSEHAYYVQEVGLNSEGHSDFTEAAARILKPNFAVLTNIGDNHSEKYLSRGNIFKCKKTLIENVAEGGTVLLNADDPILRSYQSDANIVFYSMEKEEGDLHAVGVQATEEGFSFGINFRGEIVPEVRLRVHGRHNVYNALVAYGIARICGMASEEIVTALEEFSYSYPTRQNVVEVAGCTFLIDCYNASVESILQSLETLSQIADASGRRKVAVLGDVLELGDSAAESHRTLGEVVAEYGLAELLCFGNLSRETYKQALASGISARYAASFDELCRLVKDEITPGDVVLWKASHAMHLEHAIDSVYGTSFGVQN